MASSASPSPNCYPSSLPHQEESCSSSNDCLWDEIDLAERHLVSSQFDEAAALSSDILQKLRGLALTSRPWADDVVESIEPDDMIESAGMILIQAYSETGRSNRIFESLESVFGCAGEVPPSLLLAGVRLQISAGCVSDAGMAVKSFLENRTSTLCDRNPAMLKVAEKSTFGPAYLQPEIYSEIVEIYCIHVLAKDLKSPDLALQFVGEANIPEDDKQKLIERLKGVLVCTNAKVRTGLINQCQVAEENLIPTHNDSRTISSYAAAGEQINEKKSVHRQDKLLLPKSFQILSPVVLFVSRSISAAFADHSLYDSRFFKVLEGVLKKRMVLSGAATLFLAYAIYRQGLDLKRLLKKSVMMLSAFVSAIYMGFIDFWQLAFSVQLNPLAAVHPLPYSQHVRN